MYCTRCGTPTPDNEAQCGRCGAAFRPHGVAPAFAPAPAPELPVVLRYSGFWRRLVAAAVNMLVCLPFTRAIEISLGRPDFDPTEWDPAGWGIQLGLLGLVWLYDALLESSRWQGTLGQQLLGIRVTDLAGRRISFARATGRHFGQLVSVLTLGTGYLMIAFTRRKQALHDVMSGCLLVRSEPEARLAAKVVTLPAPAAAVLTVPTKPWSPLPGADPNPPSTPFTGSSA